MNYLLGYSLKNINPIKQNMEGIDLIDEKNRIIAQVSSTCTKQKIENSLNKAIFEKYACFKFIFIAVVGNADTLRTATYKNPYKAMFSPADNIYDIKSLLNIALNLNIAKQRKLYEFIRDELGNNIDIVKMDSNLAVVINLLSQENLSDIVESPEINSFEITRKIEFNDLMPVKETIDDYKIFYSKLDEKYKEFDKQGVNKSFSVLSVIRNIYNKLTGEISDPQELFYTIVYHIKKQNGYVFFCFYSMP